jgi:hypothetical protein
LIAMSPRRGYSREEVLRLLQDFYRDSDRPPRRNEPGFSKVVTAAKKEFGSWNYALQIAGLQTYKQWSKKRTFGAKVIALLNENPLTFKEIRIQLSKDPDSIQAPPSIALLGQTLNKYPEIKAIGPRKSMVYFLEGQETLAQTRLDKIFSEVSDDEEMLFFLLRKPMSQKEILGKFPGRENKLKALLRELTSANLVYPAEFVAHNRGGSKFNSSDLFGNIAGKRYYCRYDCPSELLEFLLDNIPIKNFEDGGFVYSLLHKFRSIFPKEIYRQIESKMLFLDREQIKSRTDAKSSLDYFLR